MEDLILLLPDECKHPHSPSSLGEKWKSANSFQSPTQKCMPISQWQKVTTQDAGSMSLGSAIQNSLTLAPNVFGKKMTLKLSATAAMVKLAPSLRSRNLPSRHPLSSTTSPPFSVRPHHATDSLPSAHCKWPRHCMRNTKCSPIHGQTHATSLRIT